MKRVFFRKHTREDIENSSWDLILCNDDARQWVGVNKNEFKKAYKFMKIFDLKYIPSFKSRKEEVLLKFETLEELHKCIS